MEQSPLPFFKVDDAAGWGLGVDGDAGVAAGWRYRPLGGTGSRLLRTGRRASQEEEFIMRVLSLQCDQAEKLSAMPVHSAPQQMTITTPEAAPARSVTTHHTKENKPGISSQKDWSLVFVFYKVSRAPPHLPWSCVENL
jgi:hypothetical protein